MSEQKFHRGNLVLVSKIFPSYMSHFTGRGEEAIVVGSYKDLYGKDSLKKPHYSLLFLNGNQISWYEESLLTLLEEGGEFLIKKYKLW